MSFFWGGGGRGGGGGGGRHVGGDAPVCRLACCSNEERLNVMIQRNCVTGVPSAPVSIPLLSPPANNLAAATPLAPIPPLSPSLTMSLSLGSERKAPEPVTNIESDRADPPAHRRICPHQIHLHRALLTPTQPHTHSVFLPQAAACHASTPSAPPHVPGPKLHHHCCISVSLPPTTILTYLPCCLSRRTPAGSCRYG